MIRMPITTLMVSMKLQQYAAVPFCAMGNLPMIPTVRFDGRARKRREISADSEPEAVDPVNV